MIIIGCLLVVYVVRFRRARRESRSGRGAEYWRLACWLTGLVALAAALVSPVDTLAHQVFILHMSQHVLLLDIAPVFMILGLSKVILRPVARTILNLERGLGPLAHPAFAVVAYIATMWIWHIPAMYDAALEHDTVHVLEHVSFMTVGWLYWWHLLGPVRSHRMTGMAPVAYMVITKIGVGVLGILITFSRRPLYDFYSSQDQVWGLTALDDQATAGALMALEQSIVMGIALAFLFVRALSESERQTQREDAEADRLQAAGRANDD